MLALVALALLTATVVVVMIVMFEFPGGMPSSYPAADEDPQLTTIARDAVPIIDSINRFYAAHGECPQAKADDLVELRVGLESTVETTIRGDEVEFRLGNAMPIWSYYSSNQSPLRCVLSKKLGWDPRLVWQRDDGRMQWIFVPGDGHEDKPIHLDGAGRLDGPKW
jgi:hypothetical protein